MTSLPPLEASSLSLIPLSSLHSLLTPLLSPTCPVFQNWARTFHSHPSSTYLPTTPHEVQLIVSLCARTSQTLRARGSGHSPSDLVCTDGVVVDLRGLKKIGEVNDRGVVEVEAGALLKDLNRVLGGKGWGLNSLGSISEQTISGAISTATHGSSVYYGNLSTTITYLDLVLPLPSAPLIRVSNESQPEVFKAALCGLGAIGVIVRLGLRVEKRFRLEEECSTMRIEEFLNKWKKVAESAEYVRTWWFPQVGEVKVSRMRKTTKAPTPLPSKLYTFIFDTLLATHLHALLLLLSRPFPKILPFNAKLMYALVHRPAFIVSFFPGLPGIRLWKSFFPGLSWKGVGGGEKQDGLPPVEGVKFLTAPTTRVDWSENIFNYDCGFPQYTYEASIPYSLTTPALASLQNWYQTELANPNGLRTHFPVEVRWAEGDDIWLSPTYGPPSDSDPHNGRGTYIGIIQYRPYGLPVPHHRIFSLFSSLLTPFQARPHWAKSHNYSVEELRALYPMLGTWLRVRGEVDPAGVLCNGYLRRHLVGEEA